jgi:cation transport protein ChaC
VLGLDRGGTCRGLAFRVAAPERDEVVAYLRAREQVTAVYLERVREVASPTGRRRRRSPIVVGPRPTTVYRTIDEDLKLRIVAGARGASGATAIRDQTAAHLEELGMPDPHLSRLAERLAACRRLARGRGRTHAPRQSLANPAEILDDRRRSGAPPRAGDVTPRGEIPVPAGGASALAGPDDLAASTTMTTPSSKSPSPRKLVRVNR